MKPIACASWTQRCPGGAGATGETLFPRLDQMFATPYRSSPAAWHERGVRRVLRRNPQAAAVLCRVSLALLFLLLPFGSVAEAALDVRAAIDAAPRQVVSAAVAVLPQEFPRLPEKAEESRSGGMPGAIAVADVVRRAGALCPGVAINRVVNAPAGRSEPLRL